MPIQSINPATGAVLATYEPLDRSALEDRLSRASNAFARWKNTSFSERAKLMTRAAELLETEAGGLAGVMTAGMGKPRGDAPGAPLKSARGALLHCAPLSAVTAGRRQRVFCASRRSRRRPREAISDTSRSVRCSRS